MPIPSQWKPSQKLTGQIMDGLATPRGAWPFTGFLAFSHLVPDSVLARMCLF